MRYLKFIFALTLLTLAFFIVVKAEDQKPAKITDQARLLELQLISSKRALAQANYQNVVRQAQDLQREFDGLSALLGSKIDDLYKIYNLDRTKFDVDIETGDVIPLGAKQAAPPVPKK